MPPAIGDGGCADRLRAAALHLPIFFAAARRREAADGGDGEGGTARSFDCSSPRRRPGGRPLPRARDRYPEGGDASRRQGRPAAAAPRGRAKDGPTE